jgi:type III secretion system FlhB-like substrate exporter
MSNGFKCILAIVNKGFSEVAMNAAKACGARGGTILHGRGTASKEAEKIFNISIQPEKEIVMILAQIDLVDGILKALYEAIGSNTPAQGIAFALPVDEVAGINNSNN